MTTLYWNSKDGQGSINMGEYKNEDTANAAINDANAELIGQCTDDQERVDIENGSWSTEDQ